jgi:hypothetical protein
MQTFDIVKGNHHLSVCEACAVLRGKGCGARGSQQCQMLHIVNLLHILASSHTVIERLRHSWYRMLPLSLPSGLFVLPRIQQSRRFASRMTGWLRLPDVLAFPACDRSGVKDHGRLTHTRRQTSLPRIQRQLESIVPIPGKPPAWVLPSAHSTKPFLFYLAHDSPCWDKHLQR